MNANIRTQGERVFEDYLGSQRIAFEFEKEHTGKIKRPDYTIEWEGKAVVFDVKDFDPPSTFPMGVGAFDPYPPIREKIEQGRDKFKQFKEFCCGLVLYNAGRPLIMLEKVDIMLGSMYGDSGFTFPVNVHTGVGDSTQMKQAFLGRGKMIRPKWTQAQNTTISAIITLIRIQPHYLHLLDLVRNSRRRTIQEYEEEIRAKIPNYDPEFEVPRVIVWYNAGARIAFPMNLFRGPYDTHYGITVENDGTVYQSVTYEGLEVPERLKLLKHRKSEQ